MNEIQPIRKREGDENFRRRKSDEISKLLQFEGESVIKGFLPILDDLERMVDSKNSSEESLSDGITDTVDWYINQNNQFRQS